MATTLKLPFVRFVAQVNTAPAEPKANYQALAGRNALALQKCEWREAAKSAKATLVTHNFTVSHSGDQYDAYLMTGDYNADNSTEVAYAGMAAYRFTLPAAYLSGSQTLVSMSLPVTRDRFLLPGVRVVAVLSDSAKPSASWATVRGEASPAASETEYLKNSATRITAALDDSGTLELDLAGADSAKKNYLWIYLTVEDYAATWTMYSKTEPRLYAIEGSAMLVGEDASVTFSADVTPDIATGIEYGDYDFHTGEFTKLLDLSDDTFEGVYDSGEITVADVGTARFIVFCGENVPASMPGAPGWALYDVSSGRFISFDGMSLVRSSNEIDMTDVVFSSIRKNGGVKRASVYISEVSGKIRGTCHLYPKRLVTIQYGFTPAFYFYYDPSTGIVSGNSGSTSSLDVTFDVYSSSTAVLGFSASDVETVSPRVVVTKSGVILWTDSYRCPELYAEGGDIGWVGNPTKERASYTIDGTAYSDVRVLHVAGSFNRLGGVDCGGLAIVCSGTYGYYFTKRAYPLDLIFDTRKNLTFHSDPGSNKVFVSGDFTSINGVEARGCAVIAPPPSEWLLDPSENGYVAPENRDWRKVVAPLIFGTIEKPADYESLSYSFGAGDGYRVIAVQFDEGSKVACLRRSE